MCRAVGAVPNHSVLCGNYPNRVYAVGAVGAIRDAPFYIDDCQLSPSIYIYLLQLTNFLVIPIFLSDSWQVSPIHSFNVN